ncbi:MAG: YedE-related selenium metabolism membrane protein [Planctomycetes bacterium]|nr:YedE-related selenium metabolism membrane protein [Planctomycetota bacterium]
MLRDDATSRGRLIGILLAAALGAIAALLIAAGNPGNMGLCGVCFLRDLAGALRLHSGPSIFRPEVLGIALGALVWSLLVRRHVGRSGSHAVARFVLGMAMSFGALVFLGCPFRMLQRLGGGDLNAWVALPGFLAGVGIAGLFHRRGYSLGKTQTVPIAVGLAGPVVLASMLVLFLLGGVLAGPGPGSVDKPLHAVWWLALALALVAGGILSATGFCAVSAARQVFGGPRWMLIAAAALVGTYALVSAASGRTAVGFAGQPVTHGDWLWNVLSMLLLGLCGSFAGGCPVRQIVMAGEGNGDAFVAVGGMTLGGALAHSLQLTSVAATADAAGGPTPGGRIIVSCLLVLVLAYAAAMVIAARAQPPAARC